MLAPVLEIDVVWHPTDREGEAVATRLLEHFRGTAYSGLIGGAVEVLMRSVSESGDASDAPRALPCTDPLPYDLPHPSMTAIVVLAGTELVDAVRTSESWRTYLASAVEARTNAPASIGIFPVALAPGVFDGTELGALIGSIQAIGAPVGNGEQLGTVCRDLAQGLAQLGAGDAARVKVFVSHTKRASTEESEHQEQEPVSSLIGLVRNVISDTRLREFFDAHDLQPNQDWGAELEKEAASGALLAVRTDRYSSRRWCQREVLTAKRHGVPVVVLDALTLGEERGSYLMDHVPRLPARQDKGSWQRADVERALNQLVDECLKRVLWNVQESSAKTAELPVDVDWWAPHAPEPVTFLAWLAAHDDLEKQKQEPIIVLHPDPPLGPDEVEVLLQLARLVDLHEEIEFLTPARLAARGG